MGLELSAFGLNKASVIGGNDSLNAVSDAELAEHRRDMCLDRGLAEVELAGEFGVGKAAGDQAEDLPLALGEVGECAARGCWWRCEAFEQALCCEGAEE